MPTKTERILSLLPGTFRQAPVASALHAVAAAFGRELQAAENSLAAVMQAHWVDLADWQEEEIHDLALLAALYGLAPRPDESVEEFREHLKRYVRTFLQGTVAVQGILRVTAEALNLHIADAYADMDTWWTRKSDPLTASAEENARRFVTRAAITDEAALALCGFICREARGEPAMPAQVIGAVDLSRSVDLSTARYLRLTIDAGPAVEIDCAGARPRATTLAEITAAINAQAGAEIASIHERRFLALTSPTAGENARIAIGLPISGADARTRLLGQVPTITKGALPGRATLEGAVSLRGPVDLSQRALLRLAIDGAPPVDLTVAGAAPDRPFLDEVIAAINAALPGVASETPDHRLRLQSPTAGPESRIAVLPLRYLELIEYPARPARFGPHSLRHGDSLRLANQGAAGVFAEVDIAAPRGVYGPLIANFATGWAVRVNEVLEPGERVRLWRAAEGGLRAEIHAADGAARPVATENLHALPLAAEIETGNAALFLPRGVSRWRYADCGGSRFDQARFDAPATAFTGGVCRMAGLFDISRLEDDPAFAGQTVFAAREAVGALVNVTVRWASHERGAFVVHLPADLPPRFGGRFDSARFSKPADAPEIYPDVVAEPESDADYLATRINARSALVVAEKVASAPLGWAPVVMPFRKPRALTLGSETSAARLYLAEEGVEGYVELRAVRPGAWGNAITVAARYAGPARFELTIAFMGGRFENARRVVLGGAETLPLQAAALLKPGPVGVLQAKAAGVRVAVTRETVRAPAEDDGEMG